MQKSPPDNLRWAFFFNSDGITRCGVAKMIGFRETERSVLKYVSTVSQKDGHLQPVTIRLISVYRARPDGTPHM